MATKKAPPDKRKKKKRKIRLSLKSSKMKKTDSYTDQLGWSTDVGRTLEEKAKPKARYYQTPVSDVWDNNEGSKTKKGSLYHYLSAL